ncbi:MAG: DNA primase [Acidobacteria bacterium]|nr:DNA primase [Acidobacteriota bacterium]
MNSAKPILAKPNSIFSAGESISHAEVLQEILDNVEPVDFAGLAQLKQEEKLTQKHLIVYSVAEILRIAKKLNCGLCRHYDVLYTYNGEFWQLTEKDAFERFLSECAIKLGVDHATAVYHKFSAELYKQFLTTAYLPKPRRAAEPVIINLRNGTFEIHRGKVNLRPFQREDFLTYQLPFEYSPKSTCPMWTAFLNDVLPDQTKQAVLAEYIAYVFARHLKLEKTLILFGTGANGKSVVFDVINALLGSDNVSNYSLESLGEPYYRAMIAGKLLNYASEISNRLQAEKFKQLTSGEPVEARLPYGQPMILTDYARLAFNCNDLPRDVEHTEAFFRRFLILTFDITISPKKRNPNLAREIVEGELSGVFNWVLSGLERLLKNRNFTWSDSIDAALVQYRRESDSVAMFLDDEGYAPDQYFSQPLKTLYPEYRQFCISNGYKPCGANTFSKRLENNGITVVKERSYRVVYLARTA